MALKIVTTPLSSAAFMVKCGVTEKDAAAVLANGWSVAVTPQYVAFHKTGHQSEQILCSLNVLGAVNAGKLNDASTATFVAAVKKVVKALKIPDFDVNGVPVAVKPAPDEPADVGAKGAFSFVKNSASALQASKGFPEYAPDKMWYASPVQLASATALYQPVHGSSKTSPRYFLVAATDDLNVGARLNGDTLSVRVEPKPGKTLAKYAQTLVSVGYEVHLGKNYASVHLSVNDSPTLAGKTLGALILGMGLATRSPVPDISRLVKAA